MRTICEVVKHVIDYTDAVDVGTARNSEALTDEICKALRAEGYETHTSGGGLL